MKNQKILCLLLLINLSCIVTIKHISFDDMRNANEAEIKEKYAQLIKENYIEQQAEIVYKKVGLYSLVLKMGNKAKMNKRIVISTEMINEDEYYDIVYKIIKSDKHRLALKILSEIHKGNKSLYYPYLSILLLNTKEIPLFYQFNNLKEYKQYKLVEDIMNTIKKYKVDYIELRRVIYPLLHSTHFIGDFIFGDFLWAMHIVDSFSLTYNSNTYLIPGIETELNKHINIIINEKNTIEFTMVNNNNSINYIDNVFRTFGLIASNTMIDCGSSLQENNNYSQEEFTIKYLLERNEENKDKELNNIRQFLISKLSLLNHIAECAKARSIDIERSDL